MTTVEDLRPFWVFDRLSTEQRSVVAAIAHDVEVPAGTRLFEEGQAASGCWLIRSGQMSLESSIPGRGSSVVQTLGRGDLLGWSWLVPPHHWHFSATAATSVSAIELDTDRLRTLADNDPALGYPIALALLETVIGRLQSTRARLLDLYGSPRVR